jgi:lysophospholipase L1-like esterase
MHLTTNADGFRGPAAAPGRRPVLILGDSFTLGYGVNDGEEFPALLRAALQPRGIPVINAGLGDSGNGRWLKFLHREGERIDPRLVVLQITGNDFHDNLREGLFSLRDGALRENPIRPIGLKRMAQRLLEAVPGLADLYLVGLLRQLPHRQAGTDGQMADPDRGVELTHAILRETITLLHDRGWPVLAVLVEVPQPLHQGLAAMLDELHVPTLSIPRKQQRPDLYYHVDGHWNAAGHRFVADRLLRMILAAYRLTP